MAAKTASQALSQFQSYVAMFRIIDDFLETLDIQKDLIDTEIATGDSNYITEIQQGAMQNLMSAASNFYGTANSSLRSVVLTLAELAGSPSPGVDPHADLAFLNDYFVTNTLAVPTRGFTKNTWTAGGSNTGDGRILQLKTDFLTQDIDCAHPEDSYRMRVLSSASGGVREGQEPFEIIGTKASRAWEDNGVGNQALYTPPMGKGFNEIASDQLRVSGLGLGNIALRSMAGNSPQNLQGTNGAFETAVSGTGVDKYTGFTFISGETNASEETTAPLVGDQSMKIDGNMVFYSLLNTSRLFPKTAIAFGALVKKVISSSTLTGTLTMVLRSGGDKDSAASGTAHKTITVTIGSLTDNTTTASDETFILPAVLGADPRIEYTVTSYSDGSGTSNSLLLDEFYTAQMYQLDMGQFILPVRGATPWELDDRWTSSVVDLKALSDDGIGWNQEFLNRLFGRYLRHSAAGTTWVDPTLAPEIVVTESVDNVSYAAHTDGDDIDHGTDAPGDVTFYASFSNTGNYPLAIGVPAESGATNCSISSGLNTIPFVIMPGRSYLFTIVVTIAGSGSYDITLTWPTSDSSEATYEIDLIGTGS